MRIRLWHNPTWTNYSNINDVKKSIQRAKSEGMNVLLDFHYSDSWADPSNQEIPLAWLNQINNTELLGDLVYNYTFDTLNELYNSNLLTHHQHSLLKLVSLEICLFFLQLLNQ